MKVMNKVCHILAVVFGVVALALFFFPDFATIVSSESIGLTGSQLAFGGSIELAGNAFKMAKSADIWFCVILTVLGLVFSGFAFKYKGMKYAAPAANIVAAVYMLVIALSNPAKFVDTRPIGNYATVSAVEYNMPVVIAIASVLFAAVILGVAHLLIFDRLEVAGTKKLPLPRRIAAFFKDYKSEIKKIVWPNVSTVLKNTFVVLIICAILGLFIWLLDLGLLKLVGFILGKQA